MSNQPHSFNNSIAAIAAGFGAFFAAGGVAFGTIYAVFFYVVPKPTEWAGLEKAAIVFWSYLVAAAVGSIACGYFAARVAKRNEFIHSLVVIAALTALNWWLIGPNKDAFAYPLAVASSVLVFFPLLLGSWMGSRKRKSGRKVEINFSPDEG